jgi:hypothetical protein
MRTSIVLLGVVLLARPVAPQSAPSIYQRQTTITARIGGSPNLRDGSYQAKGTSSICGVLPKLPPLTGGVFIVEFPFDPPRQSPGLVTSISFGSSDLASRKDGTSNRFTLDVGVVNAAGGQPAAYVLNTDPPRPGNRGTATLTHTPGATTLTVTGQEEGGETISLTVTCG